MSEFTMKLRNSTIKAKTMRSNLVRFPRNYRRKTKERERERICVCSPQNFGAVDIPQVWSEFRLNSQLCDGVVICQDGVQFKIHRVILSAVSSYFKAHFTNSLNRGSPENKRAKVAVSSDIFKIILDFAYTGYCNIQSSNVEHLLKAADQYEVLGVIQLCCRFVLDQLRPTNCLGILRFSRHYFCTDLEKEGKRYIRHNFAKLLNEGQEFDHLTAQEVIELLEDDELNVRNEEIVYEAIHRWINVNPKMRKVYILPLLKCVRFGNLSSEFITSTVMAWNVVGEDQETMQYLMEVVNLIDNRVNRSVEFYNILWKPRVPYDILFAIGGWSSGSPTNFIETYDTRADRWFLSIDNDCIPRAYHGLCTLNGFIYMIGGFDGNEHFNTVRCFDPVLHKWSECACMYYPRCYVSVAMHDNKIYAMGGYNGRIRMNSAERYDPKFNQWELIKPMQRQRSDASAAVLNDKIYIVGGFNGHEVMSSGEVYDVFANQWTFIPHMLSARSGVSLVTFRDTLYALGGFNGFTRLTTGEKYTPGISNGWAEIAEMFCPRSNFATVVLDDLIFVIGGFNDRIVGSTTINYVECYDIDANEWFDASPMNLNRSALSACVIGGLPNVRDYCYMGKLNTEVGQGSGTDHDIS